MVGCQKNHKGLVAEKAEMADTEVTVETVESVEAALVLRIVKDV